MTSYASPPATHATTDPSQQRATATVGSPRRPVFVVARDLHRRWMRPREAARPPSVAPRVLKEEPPTARKKA